MTRSLYYQFSADDDHMRLGVGRRNNNAIRVIERDVGFVLYGQYVPLPSGNYRATLEFDRSQPCRGSAIIDVCADHGRLVLASKPIDANHVAQSGSVAAIEYSVRDPLTNVEVRLLSEGGIELKKTNQKNQREQK